MDDVLVRLGDGETISRQERREVVLLAESRDVSITWSRYVLEGELDVTVEGSVHPVGPNTLACIPRGARHTFAYTRAGKARVLNVSCRASN